MNIKLLLTMIFMMQLCGAATVDHGRLEELAGRYGNKTANLGALQALVDQLEKALAETDFNAVKTKIALLKFAFQKKKKEESAFSSGLTSPLCLR